MNAKHSVAEPPPAIELIGLVAAFLRQDIVPAIADAKLRYRVRAAEHLLRLAQRELEQPGDLRADEDGYLVTTPILEQFGSLKRLTDRLYAGELDIASPDILALLEAFVIEKLRIAAPEVVRSDDPACDKG
ncbi:MAG TPA: DUF6285 domain-containing protein [Rhizomicrobium sp.]|nr:DUF6285 domain-containing protein [Rhizomicrobium sp.]